MPWDSLRALAERLGVKPLSGIYVKRLMYRASDLVKAIEREAAHADDDPITRRVRELGFVLDAE